MKDQEMCKKGQKMIRKKVEKLPKCVEGLNSQEERMQLKYDS